MGPTPSGVEDVVEDVVEAAGDPTVPASLFPWRCPWAESVSRLRSLGAWLRASPTRPFAVVGILLALNLLSATLLPTTPAAVASGAITVVILLLAAAYVFGGS